MAVKSFSHIRQYFYEFGGAMLSYMGVLCGVVMSRPHLGTYRLIELLPIIPLLFAFWAIIRQYRRMDEFYKRIHSEAFALGALILGLFYMAWGFGENAGLPKLETIWVTPALIMLWGVCIPFTMLRYK